MWLAIILCNCALTFTLQVPMQLAWIFYQFKIAHEINARLTSMAHNNYRQNYMCIHKRWQIYTRIYTYSSKVKDQQEHQIKGVAVPSGIVVATACCVASSWHSVSRHEPLHEDDLYRGRDSFFLRLSGPSIHDACVQACTTNLFWDLFVWSYAAGRLGWLHRICIQSPDQPSTSWGHVDHHSSDRLAPVEVVCVCVCVCVWVKVRVTQHSIALWSYHAMSKCKWHEKFIPWTMDSQHASNFIHECSTSLHQSYCTMHHIIHALYACYYNLW